MYLKMYFYCNLTKIIRLINFVLVVFPMKPQSCSLCKKTLKMMMYEQNVYPNNITDI